MRNTAILCRSEIMFNQVGDGEAQSFSPKLENFAENICLSLIPFLKHACISKYRHWQLLSKDFFTKLAHP